MSNLIKNELIKIFKKKGIFIVLLIILLFAILINYINKSFDDDDIYHFEYSEEYIEYVKEELANLDPNKASDTAMYIEYKTILDIYNMIQQYDSKAWQREYIFKNIDLTTYINEKNTYLYSADKDEQKLKDIETKINEIAEKLNKDNWKIIATEELENAEKYVKQLEEEQKNTQDKHQLKDIELSLKFAKIDLEIAKYRIDNNLKYGNDYINEALNTYQVESKTLLELENKKESLTYEEKKNLNTSIENKEISKYIMENNIDVYKSDDVRGVLQDFLDNYGLFIVVMVIMISGTIVSDEFNKGTIKLLLVKPYSRNKILLSKFITVIIMLLFSILVVIGIELIVGGFMFGYDSISVPVLKYNFNTNTLESINIFVYLGISILTQLPVIIILATLAFCLSTIFANSAISIAIPLLLYMGGDIINMLIISNRANFMKFFITMNWNFKEYLFGNLPSMEGMTLSFSAIICIIYFLIIIIPTFAIFKNKNIKNI